MPFHFDDWYFLNDLAEMSLWRAALTPTAGHWLPVFKLVYGGLLHLGGFSNFPASLFQFAVRGLTIYVWSRILRQADCWHPLAAMLLLCIAWNEAGVVGVFRWTWELDLELSLMAISIAVWRVIADPELRPRTLWVAAFLLTLAAWCFPTGLAALLGLALACMLAQVHRGAGVATLFRTAVPFALSFGLAVTPLLLIPPEEVAAAQSPRGDVSTVVVYLAYLAFADGIPGALALVSVPGLLSGLVTLGLAVGAIHVARWSGHEVRIIVPMLIATWLGNNAMTAMARYHYGLAQAGSHRYLQTNVFFLMLLAAILVARLWQRSSELGRPSRLAGRAVLLLAVAASVAFAGYGGWRGMRFMVPDEAERFACIRRIAERRDGVDCATRVCGPRCTDAFVYRGLSLAGMAGGTP